MLRTGYWQKRPHLPSSRFKPFQFKSTLQNCRFLRNLFRRAASLLHAALPDILRRRLVRIGLDNRSPEDQLLHNRLPDNTLLEDYLPVDSLLEGQSSIWAAYVGCCICSPVEFSPVLITGVLIAGVSNIAVLMLKS